MLQGPYRPAFAYHAVTEIIGGEGCSFLVGRHQPPSTGVLLRVQGTDGIVVTFAVPKDSIPALRARLSAHRDVAKWWTQPDECDDLLIRQHAEYVRYKQNPDAWKQNPPAKAAA